MSGWNIKATNSRPTSCSDNCLVFTATEFLTLLHTYTEIFIKFIFEKYLKYLIIESYYINELWLKMTTKWCWGKTYYTYSKSNKINAPCWNNDYFFVSISDQWLPTKAFWACQYDVKQHTFILNQREEIVCKNYDTSSKPLSVQNLRCGNVFRVSVYIYWQK